MFTLQAVVWEAEGNSYGEIAVRARIRVGERGRGSERTNIFDYLETLKSDPPLDFLVTQIDSLSD